MKYTVYFELFGKKMKTEVEADNEQQARYAVLGKVIFHKIEKSDMVKDVFNEIFGRFRQ